MIIIFLVVTGLCLGSFVNALVWRIHEQDTVNSSKAKHTKKSLKVNDLSITKGRSMCPNCHHPLVAKDLIPVLSWVQLRGKCRYCHKKYDDTPVSEVAVAVLFVASYIWWPFAFDAMGTANFIVWLVMLVGFVALIIYDIKWLLLPNRIVYPLLAVAFLAAMLNNTLFNGGVDLLRDTALSIFVGGGLFYILFQVSKGAWIGGGDVKLGFLIGLLVADPLYAFFVLFLSSVLGTAFILPGMITKRITNKSKIPFGPFLIVAVIIIKLFGASFVTWYKTKYLLF